jgi:hypothetical protein
VENNFDKHQICFLEEVELEKEALFLRIGSWICWGTHPLYEKNLEKLHVCFMV